VHIKDHQRYTFKVDVHWKAINFPQDERPLRGKAVMMVGKESKALRCVH
jgi:hypothetical protein